jgi:hypothetical protein
LSTFGCIQALPPNNLFVPGQTYWTGDHGLTIAMSTYGACDSGAGRLFASNCLISETENSLTYSGLLFTDCYSKIATGFDPLINKYAKGGTATLTWTT